MKAQDLSHVGINNRFPFQAPKQAYRPPHARGTTSTFKLHDDDNSAPQAKITLESLILLLKHKVFISTTHHLPNADQMRYVFCHRRGLAYYYLKLSITKG